MRKAVDKVRVAQIRGVGRGVGQGSGSEGSPGVRGRGHGLGDGTPEERKSRWKLAQRLLRETHSVRETAELLGVPFRTLSRWLNAGCRIEWWRREKRRWRLQAQAARKARWRARKRMGLVIPRKDRALLAHFR